MFHQLFGTHHIKGVAPRRNYFNLCSWPKGILVAGYKYRRIQKELLQRNIALDRRRKMYDTISYTYLFWIYTFKQQHWITNRFEAY